MTQIVNFATPSFLVLDELQVLGVEFFEHDLTKAIIIAGENLDGMKACQPTIRLYLAENNMDELQCTNELDAFVFTTVEEAVAFAEKLPQLSAIQLLVEKNTYTIAT